MSEPASSGFAELDHLASLFRRTRSVFDTLLVTGELPDGGPDLLADEALPHIEDVEAGFRARLRAAEAEIEELRWIVLVGGLGIPEPASEAERRAALVEAMQARSGAGGEREVVPAPPRRLAAIEHARLAMAMLPRNPPADVTFPDGRRDYADIPSPRTPSEFMQRVEEIERTLWRMAAGGRPRTHDGVTRRVYGFFDAGERLTLTGLRPH
jgi:hypothetical protein